MEKTGRAVIVHEAPVRSGFGAEIAALLADKGIDLLDGPVKRVGGQFCPIPASPSMEQYYLPDVDRIVNAAAQIVKL